MGSGSVKAHTASTVTPSATALVVSPGPAPSAAAGATTTPPPGVADPTVAGGPPANAPSELVAATNPAGAADGLADASITPDVADATSSAGAAAAVTPVPTTAPIGVPAGTPLQAGGADLDDSLATLVAYHSTDGPREVLYAVVTQPAEAKVLEALHVQQQKKIPVEVAKQVDERLELDRTQQLYEQLQTIVKSTNHHLKAGDGIPAKTLQAHTKLAGVLDTLDHSQTATAETKAMLAYYRAAITEIGHRLQPGFDAPYAQGGKVAFIEPHTIARTVTVTELVPAPPSPTPEGLLPTTTRKATRIAPELVDDAAHWDGTSRAPVGNGGTEHLIDLGGGYQAVYRPHGGDNPTVFSHRGSLEIIAPPGAGHGPELVHRLGQLNLVNRPMSLMEGEWTYLQRNIWAQQLDRHKPVQAALHAAAGLESALTHDLVAERADDAIGLDGAQLAAFAKDILLEAEARALPHKVRLVRDAVAKSTGLAHGDALASSPNYQPTPRRAGGWFAWDRFDVNPAEVDAQLAGRCLSHHIKKNNLFDVVRSGVLAATERRRMMGVTAGLGNSEREDMDSGGAKSVFLRLGTKGDADTGLYWEQPSRLLRRADWYAYASDHYGSINPASSYDVSGQTRNPATLASFNSSTNEVMFRNGIDLLGAEAPSLIRCGNKAARDQILALLAKRGITTLGGKPVSEVVKV